ERRALPRCPRANAAHARARGKVGVGLGVGDALDRTFHAHLPFHGLPMKTQRGPRMREQLAAFSTLVIRVEHEAARIDVLEEDDARRRASRIIDGGERHGGGIGGCRLIVRQRRSAHCVRPRRFSSFFASAQPCAAALRNHDTAAESSCGTPRPLAYMNPTLNSACGSPWSAAARKNFMACASSRFTPLPMP